MDVMRSQIEQAIQTGCTDFKSLSQALGVGTGCNNCVAEVLEILQETLALSIVALISCLGVLS